MIIGSILQQDELNQIAEYFNKMPLSRAEKDRRINLAVIFFNAVYGLFQAILRDITNGVYLIENTEEYYTEQFEDMYISMTDYPTDREIILKAKKFAGQVMKTTIDGVNKEIEAIRNRKEDSNFYNAVELGLYVKEEEIPKKVLKLFNKDRAMLCALTEVNFIGNYKDFKLLKQSGALTKTWITMRDERVRPTHWEADGQTRLIDEPFKIGNSLLMFPCDTSLDPDPDEVILCRCVLG